MIQFIQTVILTDNKMLPHTSDLPPGHVLISKTSFSIREKRVSRKAETEKDVPRRSQTNNILRKKRYLLLI